MKILISLLTSTAPPCLSNTLIPQPLKSLEARMSAIHWRANAKASASTVTGAGNVFVVIGGRFRSSLVLREPLRHTVSLKSFVERVQFLSSVTHQGDAHWMKEITKRITRPAVTNLDQHAVTDKPVQCPPK